MTQPRNKQRFRELIVALRYSIRLRLILWNMLAITILLVAAGAVAQHIMSGILASSMDRELSKRAQGLAEKPDPTPEPHNPGAPAPHHGPNDPARPYSGFDKPQVLDLNGQVRLPHNMTRAWDPVAAISAAKGAELFTTVTVQGYPFRVVSRPYPLKGKPEGVVQVPYPLADVYHSIHEFNRILLEMIPVALLFAAIGAAFLANRALRPVREVAQAAESIGAHDLSLRLPVGPRDEFQLLTRVINSMLDRLQQHLEHERQFTADASHELRTPLAVIKANTSLCLANQTSEEHYRRSMEAIDRATDSMSHLTQDLLLLARVDEGQLERDHIALLIGDVLEEALAMVSAHGGRKIDYTISDAALCVSGNEQELVRVFVNLLQNAIRYTPEDGSICVAVSSSQEQVTVQVKDTGCGIAPEHLARLGERFYRADKARSRAEGGSGLGLAIVLSIVQAHGGEVTFESSLGVGTCVTVQLPLLS